MALSTATIPELVSSTLLELLHESLTYGKLFNKDYQGDVVQGSSVRIPSIGSVSVENYTRYTDLTGQEAADTSVLLSIDKAKAFEITIDDLDEVQATPNILAAYLTEAVFALQKQIDIDLAAALASGGTLVSGFGTSTTPIEVNSKNICQQLRSMALALDNAFVPHNNRGIVLPPWAVEKLTLASIVDATNNSDAMADGIVAKYAGFNVYSSPLVPNTSNAKYRILAGNPFSATYALQIDKTETLRHPKQFADVLRGLVVYGAKATRPGTIINGYWNLAAEA